MCAGAARCASVTALIARDLLTSMHKRFSALLVAAACATTVPVLAQWPKYPASGVPKTADGKPDMNAPAPKLANGKPDLSGVWDIAPIRRPGAGRGGGADVP